MPAAIAISEASAAPATPSGRPLTQPKISVGASAMFSRTVATWIAVGIFMSPIPRSAAPRATSGNCSASAGTNQARYSMPRAAVTASAASQWQ